MNKQRFFEIDIIRIYLIVALVLCHSFAPFSGAWKPIGEDVVLYKWIARFSYGALLETYVMLSGFLYYPKLITGIKLPTLLSDKIRRLIVPSVFLGFIYIRCVYPSLDHVFFRVINGFGHLWFLPMLFWVFIIYTILYRLIRNQKWLIAVLLVCTIAVLPQLPFQINKSFYFLIFFHLGCYFRKSYDSIKGRRFNDKIIIWLFLYLLLLIFYYKFVDFINPTLPSLTLICKLPILVFRNLLKFLYSFLGVLLLFSFFSSIESHFKNLNFCSIATLTFGVYLFQEIILGYLYYNSDFSSLFPIVYVPWVAFAISLGLSMILTYLLRRIRVVRNFI